MGTRILTVEDDELEAAGIGRHMAGNQRRELLTNELMVHGKSPEKRDFPATGGGLSQVGGLDGRGASRRG